MVTVPSQQNYSFPEAVIKFDLERLKTDLGKYEEVTDTPWQYFLGILSGYSQEEIASQLGIEKTTVKQSLTQRLKPSLIELLDLPEDTRIYWDHRVIKQLISAGYGLSKQKTCITLGRENFKEMLDKQRELTANPLINANFEASKLYVPLGLVESKKQERRKDVNPEKGSNLYRSEECEVTRQFENDEFLTEVLLQGNSPKSQGKRIAIIGEPGSGKTTRLQQVADRLFNDNDENLVIWVSLADLQDKNLEDFLLNTWLKTALKQKEASEESQNKLIEKFNEGNVWLLLDGLDEMRLDQNPLYWVNSQIKGWIESAKVILTCRVNVWESGKNYLNKFDVYRNLDFSEPQRDEFIYNFFTNCSLAEQLITALNQDGKERIRDLVKNPLRLTLVCYSWEKHQGSLPETKAGLYQECVEAFYLWKEVEFQTTIAQRKLLNQALGKLAKQALEQESSKFRLTKSFISDVLEESDEGLFKLALDLGWLNRVGVAEENPNEQVYAFFHPTFQEYFAACAIPHWDFFLPRDHVDQPVEGKVYRVFEPQWKQVFLLWLGRADIDKLDKEAFIQSLVNFNAQCGDFYYFRSFYMAAVGIAEFKNCSLIDQIIQQIIDWSFGTLDLEENQIKPCLDPIKESARKILLETEYQQAAIVLISKVLIKLIKFSQEEDEDFRLLAFYSFNSPNFYTPEYILVKIAQSSKQAILELTNELTTLIQSSPHEHTRWKASYILLKIDKRNKTALTEIIKLLELAQNPEIVLDSVYLLKEVGQGNEQVITALIKLIKSSQNEEICRSVICTLGEIAQGNEQVITALIELIKSSQNEEIYLLSIYTLVTGQCEVHACHISK